MKKPIKVDLKLLKQVVAEVENSQEFTNLTSLYECVAKQYNGRLQDIVLASKGAANGAMFPPITHSVVKLRIKEFGIKIKTKAGKRGRPMGSSNDTKPRKRISRGEKFSHNPEIQASLEAMYAEFPDKKRWVDHIKDGSMKYAIKLGCYDCMGRSTADVQKCGIIRCPFYPISRRQPKDNKEE